MCIAILNTKGIIAKKTLKTCFENNPDGAGFAFTDGEKVRTFKELKDFKVFYSAYQSARKEFPKANFLVHFRIRTHGTVNLTNCHPFIVNDKTAFIHNGMIDIATQGEYSDTYAFNETILKQMPDNFMDNSAILELLQSYIGYSKVVLLNSNDEYVILNESDGHWVGDNWFSNYSYCSYGSYGSYYSKGKSKYGSLGTSSATGTSKTPVQYDLYDDDEYVYDPAWDYQKETEASKKSFTINDRRNRDVPEGTECECCNDNYHVKYCPDEGMNLCKRCRMYIGEYADWQLENDTDVIK